MRKKIILGLSLVLAAAFLVKPVVADEFSDSSNYHLYRGGYTIATRSHFTEYRINGSNITIGAGIRVLSNPVEIKTGLRQAFITSKHKAQPYDDHTHSRYNFQ